MSAMETTRAWIVRELGLSADLLHREPLAGWLVRRAREAIPGIDDQALDERYAALLVSDPDEVERLRAMVAVPETWLFRGRPSFEFLRGWLRRRGRPTLRMLSAGCANGAEPLSMVSTAIAAGIPVERCTVDALDTNEAALASIERCAPTGLMLREGAPSWAFGLGSDHREPTLDPALHRAIRPRRVDLLRWSPEGTYDAIFCRHLLIYLAPDARRELLTRLVAALASDGVLVVGAVEATLVARLCRPVGPSAACAFERGERSDRPAKRPPRCEHRSARITPSDERHAPLERSRRIARAGDRPATEEAARARVRSEPGSVDAHRALAEILLRSGRDRAAEESLRKALYLDPEDERTLVLLAEIVGRSGRIDLAERYRIRALDAHLRRA